MRFGCIFLKKILKKSKIFFKTAISVVLNSIKSIKRHKKLQAPIFITDSGKSFAELTSKEKDAISHRGNALRILREKLLKYI